MRFIIFGPPGAGKGTYAFRLGSKLKIAKISTGDVLREQMKQNTDLGKKIAFYVNKGELVPDEIVIEALKRKLSQSDGEKGFILDGYPRTIEQAKALEKIAKVDAIIRINVLESIIVERLANRMICRDCGAVYNVKYLKPKKAGVCNICGGELYQRQDDRPEVVRERFRVYEIETRPILDYYKNKIPFVDVECKSVDVPPEVMVEKILQELRKSKLIK